MIHSLNLGLTLARSLEPTRLGSDPEEEVHQYEYAINIDTMPETISTTAEALV